MFGDSLSLEKFFFGIHFEYKTLFVQEKMLHKTIFINGTLYDILTLRNALITIKQN